MYTFKPVTKRIDKIHRLIRDRVIQTDAERAMITTEFVKNNEHMVPFLRRPMILKTICEKMTIRVEDFELIVGNTSRNFCSLLPILLVLETTTPYELAVELTQSIENLTSKLRTTCGMPSLSKTLMISRSNLK